MGTGCEEAWGCLGEQLLPGGAGGSFSPGWTLSAREEMRCILLIRETMTFGVSRHPHSTDSAYLHPFSHEVYHTFPVNSLKVLTLTQQILGVCGLSFYLIQPLTGIDLALHLHRPWLFQRNHRSFWFLTWTLTLWWGSSDNLSFFANFSSTHRNN